MKVRPLTVPDAYVLTPRIFADGRGAFLEWYQHEALQEAVGHRLQLAQANCSVSRRGTVRGVHYADVPPSQAKYVTCVSGAVLDVVVDIRTGSPTFGHWDAVRLDTDERAAVYVAEGLGHAFCALSEDATVIYLCSEVFAPQRELVLSEKDAAAPTLQQAADAGLLPSYQACQTWYEELAR
jgi:dTDP-4-dehydrorhamnose 3,5-epimerase